MQIIVIIIENGNNNKFYWNIKKWNPIHHRIENHNINVNTKVNKNEELIKSHQWTEGNITIRKESRREKNWPNRLVL